MLIARYTGRSQNFPRRNAAGQRSDVPSGHPGISRERPPAPRVPPRQPSASSSPAPRLFLRVLRPLFVLFFAFAALSAARAQSVHWENSDSGDPAELQLVFQDCAPEGDPQMPRIDGVTLALVGTSTQATLNNFSLSRSTILTFRARAQRSGPLQIPAFTVQTNKGALRVAAFNGASTRSAADANVTSRLEPGRRTVWAGEVFPLTYVLDVARRSFSQLGTNIEWNPAPLVVEDWSKFEPAEAITNGEARLNITSRTRAYAKSPGAITLNAANQLVNLQSGSIGFGLFQTPRIEQLSVSSDRPSLMVRPLPAGAPAVFNGAVGQFKLVSKVVPTAAAIGEPVTWTLELSGTGNWPEIRGLPQREVSKDFNVVQPQAKRTSPDGKLFDATLTEDVVLVPTRPGNYTIGPFEFAYFDPSAGTYRTITTPQAKVTISAPAAPAATLGETAAAAGAPADSAPAAHHPSTAPVVPAAPSAIPRDPLPGSFISWVPLGERMVVGLTLLPFAFLPIYWAWLAVQRARRNDPLRPRREARERIAATVAALRAARAGSPSHPSPAPVPSESLARSAPGATTGSGPAAVQAQPIGASAQLLLQWQHDTAVLWNVAHAAPSAEVFANAAAHGSSPVTVPAESVRRSADWARLWVESDRALYSTEMRLPADWTDRADAALAATAVPTFQAWTAFLPRNLLPFVAVIAVLLALWPTAGVAQDAPGTGNESRNPSAAAADAPAAYRRGDFAAAEQGWSAAVAAKPNDAIARHNLSLALAQQDRWDAAAAQAGAAVVQDPSDPALRAQFALACEKAGYVPAALAGFLPPGPVQSLAGNAAPGTWQFVLIGASVLFCAALAVLLRHGYRRSSIWTRRGAQFALVLASLLGLSATASLLAYGAGADRRAVIVWRAGTLRSIPTEADTTQKTTALPAGSVAVVDRTFLSSRWVRLNFENGQTGWVREEDVIPIWR